MSGNAPGAGSPDELARLPSYHQTSGSSHSAQSSEGGSGSPVREARAASVGLPGAEDDLNSIVSGAAARGSAKPSQRQSH